MAFQKRHYFSKGVALINGVEKLIGYDKKTGLIRDGTSEKMLDTFENSSFAIANFLAGRQQIAERIAVSLEKNVGFNSDGLFFNKIGLSQHEEKKVLPGERTIYTANNALMSILYFLLGEDKKAEELAENITQRIGSFYCQGHRVYRHEPDKDFFYPFNNLLMGICLSLVNKKRSIGLVKTIEKICFDDKMGLLRGDPKSNLYFTLDNSLLAIYYQMSGNEKLAEKIVKTIEQTVGFDGNTQLVYRGVLGAVRLIAIKDSDNTGNIQRGLKKFHPIQDVLTYANSTLAIAYLCLAGNFPKK
ncbi:MAG: hypothetical protein WC608_03010 [Parcubacteria group bacterium]